MDFLAKKCQWDTPIVDVYFRIYNFANGNRIREITKCKNSL